METSRSLKMKFLLLDFFMSKKINGINNNFNNNL